MMTEVEVRPGCKVTVRDDGQEDTFLIRDPAGPWRVEAIDHDSPLASALMGHRVGDQVRVHVATGIPDRSVTILDIEEPQR